MKNNKTLIVLLIITAILAIANFSLVIYKSWLSGKIPGLYPKDNWELEMIERKIRVKPSPEVIIKELDEPSVYFLCRDINCKYTEPEDLNFKQEVVLDSIIPHGKLLKVKSRITYGRDIEYYLAEIKNDERPVIVSDEIFKRYNSLGNYSGLGKWFDVFNTEEILISMLYNYQSQNRFLGGIKPLLNKLKEMRSSFIDLNPYRVYLNPNLSQNALIITLEGKFHKSLLQYYIMIASRDETSDVSTLRKEIVYNEKIPFELKSRIIYTYIHCFLDGVKIFPTVKNEYFNFLIMMIENYSGKFINTESSLPTKIDRYVIEKAMKEFDRHKQITPQEFIGFCNRVIHIAVNPETILAAHTAKTHALLKQNELTEAKNLALESLKLCKKQYIDPVDGTALNGQPALIYIIYLLKENLPVENIFDSIELFYRESSRFPVFRNNLLFIKAVMTDLTDNSPETVIKAYEKVESNQLNNRNRNFYLQEITNVNAAEKNIEFLKSQMKIDFTIDKPLYAKKYLKSLNSQTFNESGSMDVTIIQHSLPDNERKIARISNKHWKKGIINGEIYWFTTNPEYR